jgi:hypothetical protein
VYPSNPYLLQRTYAQVRDLGRDSDSWARCAALKLYRRVRNRGWLGRVWSVLTGRPRSLLELRMIEGICRVRGRHYAGTRAVPIGQIRGTEGRCQDFDVSFQPLRMAVRDRWVAVAVAWRTGMALPPVKLIQVGDVYFVRDGHHRVSVARAMGQADIDAEVIVWDAVGPLPWERVVVAGSLAHQPAWR